MTIEEITEGNKLIAGFMGGKLIKESWVVYEHYIFDSLPSTSPSKLKFHSSWDWLMPVFERMNSLGYAVSTTPWTIEIHEYLSGFEELICNVEYGTPITEKEARYNIAVQFIKWYNSNN